MNRTVPSQLVDIIDNFFEWAKKPSVERYSISSPNVNQVELLFDAIKSMPENLIPTNSKDILKFLLCLTSIRHAIRQWQSGDTKFMLSEIPGWSKDNRNPIIIIREILSNCPDQPIEPETDELNFIKDIDFRKVLRSDISTANHALQSGQWKAATVFAASVIEALFFWLVKENIRATEKDPKTPLNQWNFSELIKEVKRQNLIELDVIESAIKVEDYRNLIHPDASTRMSQDCTKGTAFSAYAVLLLVIEELSK